MKKLPYSIIILCLPLFCVCQNNLQKFRSRSLQTFAYLITASEAEQLITRDSIPVSIFVDRTPTKVFNADSVEEDKLPVGNYVLITANNIYVTAKFICISNLLVLDVNNKNKLQLDIRTKAGEFVSNAEVFVNNNRAAYNAGSETFWINKTKLNNALVKVYMPGDTLFLKLAEKDDYYVRSIPEQKRRNYQHTRIYRYLNWMPSKIKNLFVHRYHKKPNIGARGFIVFNQPKYKPLDTVKFKGYAVNKRGKPYKKNIKLYINYYAKGENYSQLINTLRPVTAGAYVGQFVLADTIPPDISCRLIFKTANQKEIIQNRFEIEEYVLDEIATYTFRSEKEMYLKNDSLRFFAAAKDANGLNVMDAKATLLLTTGFIRKYYQDTLFAQDTIYNKEINLATGADTRFVLYAGDMPKADVTLNAKLIFKNSNNELHEENKTIEYKYMSKEILVTQIEDSIKAVYVEDGMEKTVAGKMKLNDEPEKPVRYPVTLKIDPVAEEYYFYVEDKNGGLTVSGELEIEKNYRLNFSRIGTGDTLGFALSNPYKIPVYFTVFNGNNNIATGKQSGALVTWKKKMNNRRQAYNVRWQYIWAGKEQQGEETIGLLYKLLNIKINSSPTVYPGQKASIGIEVKDHHGNAAANVNLTAVSYNSQFNKDIKVQDPPYLAKYKSEKYLLQKGYENDGDNFILTKNYLLGRNTSWINKFYLDSMAYYKLLFPKEKYADVVTVIEGTVPQVSVNVVEKGMPQQIYLLYINRQLVYYNGVTDNMKYAFEVYPDNMQLGIRLKDKYIEIDSLYIQPHYKHDLSFDIDNLPEHSKVIAAGKSWSYIEMNLLEKSMWQMQDNIQNNNAYLWQGNKVVHLSGDREHIAGPFNQDSIIFYSPQNFAIHFNFEPRYQYNLSKQVLRLERKLMFPVKNVRNLLPVPKNTSFILGDTLVTAPDIFFPPLQKAIHINVDKENDYSLFSTPVAGTGALQFTKPADSVFAYYILEPADTFNKRMVISGDYNFKIKNISPGIYSLLLVTYKYYTAQLSNIEIKAGGTTCVTAGASTFSKENVLLEKILHENGDDKNAAPGIAVKKPERIYPVADDIIYTSSGGAVVRGRVIDKRGKDPVPFAAINLKGYHKGALADASGNFIFNGLRAGKYILQVVSVGYESKETEIKVSADENRILEILLNVSRQSLSEVVVVTGYATSRRNVTGSMVTVRGADLFQTELEGRVAGIQVTNTRENSEDDSKVLIRGISGFNKDNNPLYVIDGILYDRLPANFDQGSILNILVLKDASALATYGPRAINGVVIISTNTKTFRKQFKDFALWAPNFFTDKNGRASVDINYPDNITGWQTFVVAMDKERRIGKASILTQAYKPMAAELSVPQFLTDGDSVNIIGKSKNYTTDTYTITTRFSVNENTASSGEKILLPGNATIDSLKISNADRDTIDASYTLKSSTGFNDGEERKIPVFKKGTEEALGSFWILQSDTLISYKTAPGVNKLHLYAQNNTLDLMVEELDHLRRYPYYCMEQIASKLTGLALEKKIREQLKEPFNNQKEFDRLLQKIQKGQLFDGGWAWWENGKTNFYITNYVTNALLQFRENPLVEASIRNAFLYLQNQLPLLKTNELLAALFTLSNGKHEMDYSHWINSIKYDSLTQHQQWQWISIKNQQKMNCEPELRKLIDKRTATMLGGTHWGVENYSWYSNGIATTELAYKVLEKDTAYSSLCNSIIQYFLEKRHNGYWYNTVESATILYTILPKILSDQKNFTKPAMLSITGDTSFQVTSFPYKLETTAGKIKDIGIHKTGGGLVYFTLYEDIFNTHPRAVNDNFIISTYFQKNNENVSGIKAGERLKMIVRLDVLKDADYIQMEIPIPAGCNYASKNNNDWKVYKEFYKNKLLLFAESLSKGVHQFEIELEPRYSGTFTLNPAKASLMYYPIFYGRNEMKQVMIHN